MRLGRRDPGACLICGTAHGACGGGGPITVVQLPARDAAAREVTPGLFVAPTSTSVFAPLGDGTDGKPFSTATYRGSRTKKTQ